jgi:transposase
MGLSPQGRIFRACCPNSNSYNIALKVTNLIVYGSHDERRRYAGAHVELPGHLEKRVRDDHPLRRINRVLDLSFVRQQVAHTYGRRGNKSVPPEVIIRMMLLLFLDDIKSERELMRIIPERLD